MNYPKGTTKEQWDRYEIERKNHHAMQDYKQSFANDIFLLVETHGIEKAKERIKEAISMARSMDAPNEPGYYRANND
jgi:DNA polymerase III alpha subunit